MILDSVGVWSHAAAAILYAALAIWHVRRPLAAAERWAPAAALAITALWALLVMTRGPHDLLARLAEGGRNLGWLGYMFALQRGGGATRRVPTIPILYVAIACTIAVRSALDIAIVRPPGDPAIAGAVFSAGMLLRITVDIGALTLVHNLYTVAAPQSRWGIRLPMIALAAMWIYDLNVYTVAYLGHVWPTELLALRGVLMVALVPVFALASQRHARFTMRLSRSAAFQSLSLLAIGGYLATMAVIARLVRAIGGDYAQVATIGVVFVMSIGALLFLPSRRMQAWLRVTLAKHLFRHRYDYRAEWLRFTDTLGRPGGDAAPLDLRAVKAIADITESPGGLLLLPDEDGGLTAATRWNWPTAQVPPRAATPALARMLGEQGRILSFDEARRGTGHGTELIPGWIIAEESAWAAVPLVHVDRLVGVVLLARPWPDRTLDWEDFDLLRVAGRQVASYIAEARGQEALSDARRFDEFNRRFAFILHDIKNLVSQLSVLTRNAERHADNPAFRADMIETLRSSTARMNDLLARLSQHHQARTEEPRPTALGGIVDAVVAARGGGRDVRVVGRRDIIAAADGARLEQALCHLVQNAVDASAPGEPVLIRLAVRGADATIEVIDRGSGMSAEFIRAGLFRPFASTKPGGFGIGAFEARAIVAAMGGRLEVESHEGEGSRFTILLPLAHAAASPQRAVA
ncbi:XrtA/PEP-CTERM system histidine kinase PrsK [Sphingomonas profundi]|uniref:XrtA/PEP-CTERM system histidine kinase PrsK n=1 Tax=Alterirhizorhabdus profundi TaxID=2681549 RepID=UPI0012E7FB8E|nr:XrtA/PEP-CTERM system histidine kinase PrsK [Sphingomonas profundi]